MLHIYVRLADALNKLLCLAFHHQPCAVSSVSAPVTLISSPLR